VNRAAALTLCIGLAACAQPAVQSTEAASALPSAMCDVFGYQRGTEAYGRCASEAEKALLREQRAARARVNCTPMGDELVCR
jgi:hypothetical protein